jgi:hypothetical protein
MGQNHAAVGDGVTVVWLWCEPPQQEGLGGVGISLAEPQQEGFGGSGGLGVWQQSLME